MKESNNKNIIYDWIVNALERNGSPVNVNRYLKSNIDLILAKTENAFLTMYDKADIIDAGKEILRYMYSSNSNHSAKKMNTRTRNKVNRLLDCLAEYESERLELYLLRIPFSDRLDLRKVMKCIYYKDSILSKSVDEILERYFVDAGVVNVYKSNKSRVFITETGKKYHGSNCRYCTKIGAFYEINRSIAEYYGLKACKCLNDSKKLISFAELPKASKGGEFMTVFIDESNRANPWREDGIQGKCIQGSYSYYICKGSYGNGNIIDEKFIVDKGVGTSSGEMGTTHITQEAIAFVLFKLKYVFNYDGNVRIYIDNQSVCQKWKESDFSKQMSDFFEYIEVTYIPRYKNQAADSLGRKVSIFDIPTSLLKEIVQKCKQYDAMKLKGVV